MKISLSTISSEQKTFTESLYMFKWKNGDEGMDTKRHVSWCLAIDYIYKEKTVIQSTRGEKKRDGFDQVEFRALGIIPRWSHIWWVTWMKRYFQQRDIKKSV